MSDHDRPTELFVIGSGRSGTTIVLEAINCLDGMAAVPRLAGRVPALTGVASRLTRVGRLFPRALGGPSAESTALFTEAGLTQAFQSRLGRSVGPEDASELRLTRLVHRLRSVRTNTGAVTVVVKNTASCGRIPILGASFPQAAFLHVVRSPAPVIRSLLNAEFWSTMTLWWDGRTTQQYGVEEGLTQEAVAARHWVRQVSTAQHDLQLHVADRYATLRYDDFIGDPLGTLGVLKPLRLPVECSAVGRQCLSALDIRSSADGEAMPTAILAAVEEHCTEVASTVGIPL